eukprot:TRINITY_DN34138_c1_g2_i1.p1 TRINITY_DN34138_c1_g2~~TRINITY_DN34138_c1_g2_i1.p1  ORF type:complete len:389 (+),score=83.07 TRINITY_DN34138_c1_g2_i1:843-2009(+)
MKSMHGVRSSLWLSVACPPEAMSTKGSHETQHIFHCTRESSYASLIKGVNHSMPNLHIRSRTFAHKLRWGPSQPSGDRHAAGLELVELNGDALPSALGYSLSYNSMQRDWAAELKRRYAVKVRREVILSAGAVFTPALLLRSGMGSPEAMERLQQPTIINDTTVGEGLRDRIAISGYVITSEPCDGAALRYDDVPDIIAFYNFSSAGNTPGAGGQVEAELNVLNGCAEDTRSYSLRFILQRTEGVGRLHVASQHPFVSPQAEMRTVDNDMSRCRNMLRWFFNNIIRNPGPIEHVTGIVPEEYVLYNDEHLNEFIRQNAQWYNHPSGSMSSSVEARSLKVKGLSNVHVADGSALASGVPSGHPDIAIRMVGDTVARRLLEKRTASSAAT